MLNADEDRAVEDIAAVDEEPDEIDIKTVDEALRSVRQLRRFLDQKGIASGELDKVEDSILVKSSELCRQSKITDYFNK